jgi:hypothetical protein
MINSLNFVPYRIYILIKNKEYTDIASVDMKTFAHHMMIFTPRIAMMAIYYANPIWVHMRVHLKANAKGNLPLGYHKT